MTALRDAIKKVATGPHLSKDLSEEAAFLAMQEVLSGEADPVQAALFLIALRMKTETREENLGILRALQSHTRQQPVAAANLVILSEPFNGFNRYCPVGAFLPAVLASCGVPTVSQGVYKAGPKFGVTHAQVLKAAGVAINDSVVQAKARIEDDFVRWAWVDQSQASPALYALQGLRQRMVKRTCLATLEKMLMPLTASATHLVTGYVHKAYPPLLTWLASRNGFQSALVIHGIEGGIIPNLRDTTTYFQTEDSLAQGEGSSCHPQLCNIVQTTRGVLPSHGDSVTAEDTAEQGLRALQGEAGAAFDALLYSTALIVWHCGRAESLAQAAGQVRENLSNGQAYAFFQQGTEA